MIELKIIQDFQVKQILSLLKGIYQCYMLSFIDYLDKTYFQSLLDPSKARFSRNNRKNIIEDREN
jgi:hypothetical protein